MKNLLLAGATMLAMCCAGSSAQAAAVSIAFDGLCDGMDITMNTPNRAALELGNGCDVGAHFGIGTISRFKDRGRAITFAVNLSGKGGSGYQYVYVVDYPLVTGGTWSNFYTQDGVTMSRISTGTYTVGGGDKSRNGLKSSTDLH